MNPNEIYTLGRQWWPRLRLALVVLLSAVILTAQTAKKRDQDWSSSADIGPSLIPASATDAIAQTVYIRELTLTNESGSSVDCTIQDKQGTPRKLFVGSVAANTLYVMKFDDRKMPGGITWSCSSGTAITGYLSLRY